MKTPLNSDVIASLPKYQKQDDVDGSSALVVPQRTYAIAKLGNNGPGLVTRRISTCFGCAGVNAKTNIAFLVHYDLCLDFKSTKEMLDEIEAKHGGDLSGFVIYDVVGITWLLLMVLVLLAVAIWFFTDAGWWFSPSLLLIATAFQTRWLMRAYLAYRGVGLGKWKIRRPGWGLTKAYICIFDAEKIVVKTGKSKEDDLFLPSKGKGLFRLTKAPGSL